MEPFLEALRAQHKEQKKEVRSSEWIRDKLAELNEHYYPAYRQLVHLAEAVHTARAVTEQQWTELCM